MSFWVYLLRCADQSYYIGHTDDLETPPREGGSSGRTASEVFCDLPFRVQHGQT